MINYITSENISNKVVFLRADLNVPFGEKGVVTDSSRIDRLKPTITMLVEAGCKIVIASHLGRPSCKTDELSLKFLTDHLVDRWEASVSFSSDCIGGDRDEKIKNLAPGEILLLENVRFYKGESANNLEFAKKLASGMEVYVNDAFACSHRSHASVDAITNFLPKFGGLLMKTELANINSVIGHLETESTAITGGAKVSSKFDILQNLSHKVTNLVIGGAMANTFLEAKGYHVGESLHETDLVGEVRDFLKDVKCNILLPVDVVTAKKEGDSFTDPQNKILQDIEFDDCILDAGVKTTKMIERIVSRSKLLLWNGPLGMFEDERFATATFKTAEFVAKCTEEQAVKSVAGGGDIVSALNACKMSDKFSYISTAGGAFLEYIGGHPMPGLEALSS